MSAYQAIHKYEHTGGFRAWVKRIAINMSISTMRKKKIQLVELDEQIAPEKVDEEVLDEAQFAFKVEEVKKAIDILPENYRTIVQLYLFEQLPQEEIAQMLGITHNNVRIIYHRAKQKILLNLKEGGLS